MDRHPDKENMDQAKGYEHVRYTAPDHRDEGLGPINQRFSHDPSVNINTNVRPPDYGVSTPARPVNYSIQTGEEFAFEFMRDRVIMKPQFIPNVFGEPSGMPVPVNLTAMKMVHPTSDGVSNTTVLNTEEKHHTFEQERKPPSRVEDKTYHALVQSAPVISSRNDTGRKLHSLASRASDSSLNQAKFLCSFGGKIIPRPRDQKLRYVGGETRIIRISKTISFQELMHKMTEMFPQARTIKYQLPGEDLDALVSVSSDEDLQNMMEECLMFGNGGSEKPRMFLFSSSDVEEAQFVMGVAEGDSEVQYVVAVNGMDLSSQKSSLGMNAPANNFDEVLHGDIDRRISRAATEPVVVSAAPMVGNESLASQTSQPVTGFPTGNESFSQPYLGQQSHFTGFGNNEVYTSAHMESTGYIDEKGSAPLHVQPQPHCIPYSLSPETPVESLAPPCPQKPEQVVLREEPIFHVQHPETSSKEARIRRVDSFLKENDPAYVSTVESNFSAKEPNMRRESSTPRISENSISSMPGDMIDHLLKEAAPTATQTSSSTPDPSSSALSEKGYRKSQDLVENNLSAKEPEMRKEHSTTRVNEIYVSSVSSESMVPDHKFKEEAPIPMKISNSTTDPKSFVYPEKSLQTSQGYVPKTAALNTASEGIKTNQESQFYPPGGFSASGHVASDCDSSNLSSVDQPVPHQRFFHSERTLRDLAETNRLSKSDDSLGSQFVTAQSTSDAFLPISESSEIFHEANMESQIVHSTAPVRSAPESMWTGEGSMSQSEKRNLEPTASEHVSQTETSIKAGPRGHFEKRDIVVDINDRFPRDFLDDILKVKESLNFPGLGPLHADGAGVSLNVQNDDPKTWSYFQNFTQGEFERKDLSLMDQDHPGFPTSLTTTNGVPIDYSYPPLQPDKVASSQINQQIQFDENIQPDVSTTSIASLNTVDTQDDYGQSQIKGAESTDPMNTGVPFIDVMAADSGMRSPQMDVKNAFLQGELEDEVYMVPPPGLEHIVAPGNVLRLRKAIYGLKQSPRAWYHKLSHTLRDHGFRKSEADHTLFTLQGKNGIVVVLVYVDDIIITGSDKEGIKGIKEHLKFVFDIKDLGEMKYFLGIEVCRSKEGLFLSQRKYTLDLLNECDIGPKSAKTPLEDTYKATCKGEKEDEPFEDVHQYRKMVGKLIYLTITRPDLCFAVNQVSQHMQAPKKCHWEMVDRILRYIKGTPGQGIWMGRNENTSLVGYCDADWAGDRQDRKSTTGYCTFLGGNLVTWKSKKQKVVSCSSAEAEYRAMRKLTDELIWLKALLKDLGVESNKPITMHCDNQAAIHIASNSVFHERTKHIEVDCHKVREKVEQGVVLPCYTRSSDQLADIFTKAASSKVCEFVYSKLGLIDVSKT